VDIGEEIVDIIVAGSGCTGAMAAQTLIGKGANVLMMDVGTKPSWGMVALTGSFLQIRREDPQQYKYWLGENFESLAWGKTETGAQLTPERKYVIENTSRWLPFISDTFTAMESLSLGGLGGLWGLGCNVYSEKELMEAGLSSAMNEAYQVIANRIGISGNNDDALPYNLGSLDGIQPAIEIDSNSEAIYKKYKRKRDVLNKNGFYLGKPALALLTEKKDGREPVSYNEMDFYSNRGLSAYRPELTIEKLKKEARFRYFANAFITGFKEESGITVIHYEDTLTGENKSIKCRKLVLCTSTLSTARIVLRSIAGEKAIRLPLLSDPYKYFTMLQPARLGIHSEEPRTALAQLMLFHDPEHNNFNVSAASIYSYRSLMLFRAVKELPVNFKDARILLKYILPAVSIMGVHHPDTFSADNYVELVDSADSITKDMLKITYSLLPSELDNIKKRERKISAAMRKLGCYTLKKIDPGYGSSVHYAGCLPFSNNEKDFHLHPSGRLYGTGSVFVADGSGFRYLPAKGITLSLMANAHLVALNTLQNS
jgi:hypothetical protein